MLPSFSEQWSYVAIEMMMFGLPIIGTDSTGLAEMIKENRNGFKIELQNTEEGAKLSEFVLAKKIIELLNCPYKKQLGENGRELFLQKYTISRMQNALRSLIVKL